MSGARFPNIRKFTSVRSRLTLWNVLVLTVALTAVSVQIRYSVRANILASIDRELSSMARYSSRMFGRRGRLRNPGTGTFGGEFPAQSFSGTMRQLDAQVGLPTPPGTVPEQAPDLLQPQNGAQGAAPVQNSQTAGSSLPTQSPPPAQNPPVSVGAAPLPRLRRNDVIPNNPAARAFVHGPHTFLNEGPWDMTAYKQCLTGRADVYTILTSTVNNETRSCRILSHPIYTGTENNVIQCVFPLAEMERAAHSLDVTLLTTIPLVLLIAGIGGAFLTDRSMRPVRHITRTAEQIGAEDLSRRLPVGTNDEFSHLADTFNAMLGRLESSFSQQRRFTADASHELKSPLTVIKANASLALRSPRTADEYVRRIEAIDKASNHMRVLVDDLLLLAHADEGRLAADKEAVSLTDILRDAADSTHRPDAAQLTLVLPASPLMLNGDRHELMRVFRNLIENALRYTPSKGSVTVTAQDEGVAVCVTVTDTGEGIAEEHIPHLGERFYRVEASRARTHGGSGLGLAICRSIIEAHHGDITFRSQEHVGTTVVVTLPTTADELA